MARGKHVALPGRRGRISWITLGLIVGLVAAMSIPAGAGGSHNKATGDVTWTARSGALPGLVSVFDVHDEAPGAESDRGTHTLYRPADATFAGGTIIIDVKCVNVTAREAWFAGVAVYGDGGYEPNVGDVYLYWVKDVATSGADGDLIGGRGYSTLKSACVAVDVGAWTGTGAVTDGNLKTHYWDS